MDINYKEVISFSPLKDYLDEHGIKAKFISDKTGDYPQRISNIIKGVVQPKTDFISSVCALLKTRPSNIVEFKDIEIGPYFTDKELPYLPPLDANGELTYKPFWNFLETYLEAHPDKTANDLFDQIEPPRRRNGVSDAGIRKALELKGYTEDYNPATRKRTEVGLPVITRTKLRNDRPLNIRTIYDICRFLGCPIDWVLSYK